MKEMGYGTRDVQPGTMSRRIARDEGKTKICKDGTSKSESNREVLEGNQLGWIE